MSVRWFTADPHFRHRLVAGVRGFDSPEEHDAWLLDLWRRRVGDLDTVYILGDLTVRSRRPAYDVVRDLPGRKVLIAGNHDTAHPMHDRHAGAIRDGAGVFEMILPFTSMRLAGRRLMLSHFPYKHPTRSEKYDPYRLIDTGLPLLHGHTHSTEKLNEHPRQLHVGVDAWRDLVPEAAVTDWLRTLPG